MMLTVFVLTVVLTASDVLGDENYCNLDLAQTLCMENFNLTKVGGKLVTMMMMIMTSTKIMVVVILIIMMVMVIMLMLIVLLLVDVMLQMAMVVIAMITMNIPFMIAMIIK